LSGKGHWDFLGGERFYEELIQIFAEVGEETKQTLLGF